MKNWEVKDRTYVLKNGLSPLTYTIKSRGILWFDEEKKVNREIRYATNQNSLFRDEQDEFARLSHITFLNGVLHVPRTDTMLQQLLSLYHPKKNELYEEIDEVQEAIDDLDMIEFELEAMKLVQEWASIVNG